MGESLGKLSIGEFIGDGEPEGESFGNSDSCEFFSGDFNELVLILSGCC